MFDENLPVESQQDEDTAELSPQEEETGALETENPVYETQPRPLEQKPRRSVSMRVLLIILVCGLIGCLAVGAYLLFFSDRNTTDDPAQTNAPSTSDEANAPAEAGFGKNDVTALADYALLTTTPDSTEMQAVVAVNANGDALLTNSQLQILYWMEFYQFLNSYGSYASMFGLDYTTPLAGQASLMENRTWEQYFLESATVNFSNYYALARAAEADGYVLPEDLQKNIDDLSDPDGEFAQAAEADGFESPDAYLQAQFGEGTNLDAYRSYLATYYLAMSYYDDVVYANAVESVTDDAVVSYYDENAASYEESGVLKKNNVSVRHILIEPEGDKDTETNTWSEEAWANALHEAEQVLAKWREDPTEEYFAQLANENSDDGGSNTTGGLYEDFAPGDMVAGFNEWCFDSTRAEGDAEIVQSEFGYHIIFFKGETETREWFDKVKDELISNSTGTQLEAICKEYPVSFDFTQMRVFDMVTKSVAEAEADAAQATTEVPDDALNED